MKKLTRKQVAEGLQSVPIETVLLGAAGAKETKLTPKQRAFAEGIALGKSKAQAYRDAYNTQAKPIHQSHEGAKLVANPIVARQIDALRLAAEARKYATPAALRTLVIERLTAHAIDEDVKPAQRLRALELLGKVTEIAAFTERREIVRTDDSSNSRSALLDILRSAIAGNVIDAQARPVLEPVIMSADAMLEPGSSDQCEGEPGSSGLIADEPGSATHSAAADEPGSAGPGAVDDSQGDDPTGTHPPETAERSAHPLLSNPRIRSHEFTSLPSHDPASVQDGVTAKSL
jgi:hypothetical protein